MCAIGLYDIDLWHGRKSYPNLELMKVYNYLNSNNYKVVFLRPQDNTSWISKVLYFKDDPNALVPNKLDIYNKKSHIYGYGFYKAIAPLKPEIAIMPPSYLPYDAWSDKLKNKTTYDKMKRSSYVRLETNDFSDYKTKARDIYIADHEPLYKADAESFFQEYKNHNFIFVNPLFAKDENTVSIFNRYTDLFNKPISINFRFSEDFFYNNYKEKLNFFEYRWLNDSEENYYARIIKMILWFKKNSIKPKIYTPFYENTLKNFVFRWGINKNKLSYKDTYLNNKVALSLMDNAPSYIRLLLKQNPDKIKCSTLDLKNNL